MSVKISVQAEIKGVFYEGEAVLHEANVTANKLTFPGEYLRLLDIVDKGDHWQVKPKHFIRDKQDFNEIDRLCKQYKGTYVTYNKATKEGGLWRIPK